jgi:phosphoribosylformylglycinamidine (FGAM) synthase-like enzyme
VGLRETLDGIPHDEFQKEAQSVFWLRLPLVKAHATLEESSGFSGEFDPQKVVNFIETLRKSSKHFESSKAVGRAGLAKTLVKMSVGDIKFKAFSAKLKDMADWEFLIENLYEVVVSVDKSNVEKMKSELTASFCPGLEVHEIGETGRGKLKLREGLELDFEKLSKESYEKFLA